MAQTLIASPQSFTAAYNPVKFIVDSTNKSKDGFRYIFDIYEAGTSNKIAQYKPLPTFGTGYGEQDLSKLLQNKVSWDLDTSNTGSYAAPNSYYLYDVKIGEEYTFFDLYTSSLTNASGNVRINMTNSFAPGDQLIITQDDGGVANPQLEGLHTVISVTSTSFVVNVNWSTITNAAIDGSVSYADKRKTDTPGIIEIDSYKVFNGAFRWEEWTSYDGTDFLPVNATKRWLTNQPTSFQCTLGQDLWLNLWKPNFSGRIYFQNSNGDSFYKIAATSPQIMQAAVGPNNYGTLTGTGDLIDNSVEWYDVWFNNDATGTSQDTLKYRIHLDRRASISEHELLFLDRLGSWSSFSFQLRAYQRGDVTRDMYNRDVVGYVNASDEWTYTTEDFGFNTFNINVIKRMELNTNWMTQEMATYFEELITSPQVFIKSVSYTCGDDLVPSSSTYQPVIVETNAYEMLNQRNKNLMRQSITVRFANQDNING